MIIVYLWISLGVVALFYWIISPKKEMKEEMFCYIYGIDSSEGRNDLLTATSTDEIDMVPLIRGIKADDCNYRKQSILAVVKDNNEAACIKALNKALIETDTETSHYASVALVGMWDEILCESNMEDEDAIHNRIQFDLLTENIEQAAKDCRLFEEKFCDSEKMVVDNLKFFIYTRDSENLEKFLQRINNYSITFTDYSIQYLSVLEEGLNAQIP